MFFHQFTYSVLLDWKILKGKVSIAAKPGVKLEIPNGAMLENKVNVS